MMIENTSKTPISYCKERNEVASILQRPLISIFQLPVSDNFSNKILLVLEREIHISENPLAGKTEVESISAIFLVSSKSSPCHL